MIDRRATLSSTSINMTPLIDVVFLLIVFFMLVAQFTRQGAVPLEPPRLGERSPRASGAEPHLTLSVVPDGTFRFGTRTFDDSTTGLDRLAAALAEAHRRRPGAELLVRADRDEPYERVHRAMEVVQASSFDRAAVVFVPRKEPQ